jgi:3-dehydroquinate synthase
VSEANNIWTVDTPQYPIRIGRGVRERVAQFAPPNAARFALISDSNVCSLHCDSVREKLAPLGHVETLPFPAGEAAKTREMKADLEDRMLATGFGRDCVIVAVGGGVTLDLAGFVASTFMRGVPWISLPTSLLAAVDAGVGGKTGVNAPAGKNLIGAFYPPLAVLIDLNFLTTLPTIEMKNGLAEMVKHAVIADKLHLDELLATGRQMPRPDLSVLGRAIHRSVQIKAHIAGEDPYEQNLRQVLNLGHTIGHAVEKVSKFEIRHGLAVSIGIAVVTAMAVELGIFPEADRTQVIAVLKTLDLPTRVPHDLDEQAILESTRNDKKGRHGRTRYVLPAGIGKMAQNEDGGYGMEIDDALVLSTLRALKDSPA